MSAEVGSDAWLTEVFRAKLSDSLQGVSLLEELAPTLRRAYASPSQVDEHAYSQMLEQFKTLGGAVAGSLQVLDDTLRQHEAGVVNLQLNPHTTRIEVENLADRFGSTFDDMNKFFDSMSSLNDRLVAEDAERPAKKNGCYLATAIYGSYDAPEVWVLRRFRDDVLNRTTLGKAFIRAYYVVSPTAVR
jgi:hypothetical protein